jgi:hypothetical protein
MVNACLFIIIVTCLQHQRMVTRLCMLPHQWVGQRLFRLDLLFYFICLKFTIFTFDLHLQVLVILLRYGGDINVRNNNGETPLMLAKGYEKAEKVLREASLEGVNGLKKYGQLPSGINQYNMDME